MSKKLKIEPCPFCRSTEVEITEQAFKFIFCVGCFARGPSYIHASSDAKIVEAWNKVSEAIEGEKDE